VPEPASEFGAALSRHGFAAAAVLGSRPNSLEITRFPEFLMPALANRRARAMPSAGFKAAARQKALAAASAERTGKTGRQQLEAAMAPDPDVQAPIVPKTGVIACEKSDHAPVCKTIKSYRNKKGAPASQRVRAGKRDAQTGNLIPNGNFRKRRGEKPALPACPSSDSIRGVGVSFPPSSIMGEPGLEEILDEALGPARSKLAQTAAMRMIARSDAFEGVSDYRKGFTLGQAPSTSRKAE
jgi:hypothetical protein